MSKPFLVTTREREMATQAFCEEEEAYITLAEVDQHVKDGCRVTFLRWEVV